MDTSIFKQGGLQGVRGLELDEEGLSYIEGSGM